MSTVDLTGWPIDTINGNYLCSPSKPMPRGAKGHWSHTNIVDDGECSEGCCDDYKCTDCGHTWRVEAAQ